MTLLNGILFIKYIIMFEIRKTFDLYRDLSDLQASMLLFSPNSVSSMTDSELKQYLRIRKLLVELTMEVSDRLHNHLK